VERYIVYLDFRSIQALSQDDFARLSAVLRPDDEESCVWLGEAATDLKVCIDVDAPDSSLAAATAVRDIDTAVLGLGLAGEVRKVVACTDEGQFMAQGAALQALDRRAGQSYCDWCMGPLTLSSIAESERLGLHDEFAWACGSCLEKGAHRRPPDGWEPPESEWPFRDAK